MNPLLLAKKVRDVPKAMEAKRVIALRRATLLTEREIKKNLSDSKGMAPLAESTKILRGQGARPLLDNGDLLGSITTRVDPLAMEGFVGVLRTARSGDGKRLINVALAHEFGTKPFMIPVTDAVRRFFLFLSIESGGAIKPLSASTTMISHPGVPARPFIRPALKSARSKILDIFGQEIEAAFRQKGLGI